MPSISMKDEYPTIIYALVASGTVVLGEYSTRQGNFPTVIRMVLPTLPMFPARASYIYDEFVLHQWIAQNNSRYIALSPKTTPNFFVYHFLHDVDCLLQRRLNHDVLQSAKALSLNHIIAPVLEHRIVYWDTVLHCKPSLGVQQIRDRIAEIKDIMIANIDHLLAREEKISLLVERTEELSHDASQLQYQAKRCHRQEWWKRHRWTVFFLLILVIVCLGVLFSVINDS